MRNGAVMAQAGAIHVSANRAVAGTTAMTGTGANDTLARPPVDWGESLRFALFWQDSGPRGAGMRPSQPRLKYVIPLSRQQSSFY